MTVRQPLRWNMPFVNPDGTPSQQFMRLWQEALAFRAIVLRPSSDQDPTNNGDLVIEATNNTTLTFKYKGTDGVTRSGTITLT